MNMLDPSKAKGALDLLRCFFSVWRTWRNPLRQQASRILAAFAAHGIQPAQIPWVLPASFDIPSAAWAYPEDLAPHVSPALQSWVAGYLALELPWLLGVSECSRARYDDGYKYPARWHEILRELQTRHPESDWTLLVFKPDADPLAPGRDDPFVLVLQECFAELHGEPLYRYYQCSEGWRQGHSPCVQSLMAHCAIARQLNCFVRGHALPLHELEQLDSGAGLIPDLIRKQSGLWHPDDILPNAGLVRIAGYEHLYPELNDALRSLQLTELTVAAAANATMQPQLE